MRKILIVLILFSIIIIFYQSCRSERENLNVVLSFQYNEGGLSDFIDRFARKIVVSVYGNNFEPIKKSVDFPSIPEWVCLHDGGFYQPDSGGFENDTYIPPYCEYPDRQFAKVVVSLSVPVGIKRSLVVETVDKDGNVTFRGSKSGIDIKDDTTVDIEINPVVKFNISVFELSDIVNSKYEPANAGKLRAYYFEPGKRIDNNTQNYATLIGEQEVSSEKPVSLEFAYSGQYSKYDSNENKSYLYPSLFGYYKGGNDAISFIMPGLAESSGFGLEPGGSYDTIMYAAMRDKIMQNPVLTSVTPSEIIYSIHKDPYGQGEYGSWNWMYAYLSYIRKYTEPVIFANTTRVKIKPDYTENTLIFSDDPQEDEFPFGNEFQNIGKLENIESELYMGFIAIPLTQFDAKSIPKSSGEVSIWMEFETVDGKIYKTNQVRMKYRVNRASGEDAGYTTDGGL